MKYTSKCKCGWPFIPDNRHVGDSGIEDCKPSDNLEYLEFILARKETLEALDKKETLGENQTPRSNS